MNRRHRRPLLQICSAHLDPKYLGKGLLWFCLLSPQNLLGP